MKLFVLSLLVCWSLTIAIPPAIIADPISSPFVKRGVNSPRVVTEMHSFNKKHVPHHFKKKTSPNYRHWRHGFFLFPYYMSDQGTRQTKSRTSQPPPQKAYKEPIVLDPAIFNPEPKTPLTLVIQDGVVVDRYLGY